MDVRPEKMSDGGFSGMCLSASGQALQKSYGARDDSTCFGLVDTADVRQDRSEFRTVGPGRLDVDLCGTEHDKDIYDEVFQVIAGGVFSKVGAVANSLPSEQQRKKWEFWKGLP